MCIKREKGRERSKKDVLVRNGLEAVIVDNLPVLGVEGYPRRTRLAVLVEEALALLVGRDVEVECYGRLGARILDLVQPNVIVNKQDLARFGGGLLGHLENLVFLALLSPGKLLLDHAPFDQTHEALGAGVVVHRARFARGPAQQHEREGGVVGGDEVARVLLVLVKEGVALPLFAVGIKPCHQLSNFGIVCLL